MAVAGSPHWPRPDVPPPSPPSPGRQGDSGEAVLRGTGVLAVKSPALLLVSVHPPLARWAAVLLESVGAGPLPSKKLAPPYPTRSMMRFVCASEHGVEPPLQPSDKVLFTRATLPAVPLMLIEPATSGVGSGMPLAPPDASCTKNDCPEASVTEGKIVIRPEPPKRPV